MYTKKQIIDLLIETRNILNKENIGNLDKTLAHDRIDIVIDNIVADNIDWYPININIEDDISEFYTYRKAFTNASSTIELNKSQKDYIKDYIKINGYSPDNHISWKSGNTYYTLSDGVLYIGATIRIKNW